MAEISMSVELPASEVVKVRAMLNLVDPKLKRALAKDLRTGLKPIAENIAGSFPSRAPLSGMAPRWGGVSAKVVTNSMAREGRALALFSMSANPASFARLLSITERAGSRSGGLTPQGRAMISNSKGGLQQRFPLDGKGGRFLFRPFRRNLPKAVEIARQSMNDFVDKFNRS